MPDRAHAPSTGWRRALREAGFIEGQNFAVEIRVADRYDQLPELAAELVAHRVDVILAVSGIAASAAKMATSTIPIVFSGAVDPVGLGLVDNIQRPGRNVTGVAAIFEGLAEKRLERLHVFLPAAHRIGHLLYQEEPNPAHRPE